MTTLAEIDAEVSTQSQAFATAMDVLRAAPQTQALRVPTRVLDEIDRRARAVEATTTARVEAEGDWLRI